MKHRRTSWTAALFCVLFVLLLTAACPVHAADAVAPHEAGEADYAAKLHFEGEGASAAGLLSLASWAAILGSYLWLLCVRVSGGKVFDAVRLPEARWTGFDVFVILLVFLALLACFGVVGSWGGEDVMTAADSTAKLAGVCIALEIIRRRGQDPRDAMGLRVRGLARHMIPGLAVFFAVTPFIFIVGNLWQRFLTSWVGEGFDPSQEAVRQLIETNNLGFFVQMAIAAVLVAPVAEELFFRGLLYGFLRRHVRPGIAILAVGVLFGVVHPLGVAVSMVVLGCLLCYVYEKTGRLAVPMAIHLLFNLMSVVLIMLSRFSQMGTL